MEGGAQRYWDPVVSHSQSHSSDTYISSLCSSRNSSIPTGSTHAPDAGMIFQEKIRLLKQTMEQQRLQRQREFNEQQQKRHQQQQQELLRRQTEMRSPSVSSRAGSRTVRGPVASLSFSPSPPPSWRRLTGDALAENNTDCSHHSNGSSPELVVVEASPVRKDTTASPLRCDASTMTESILEERTNRVTSKKKNAKEASLDRATVVSPAVVASGSARDDSPAATEMCEKGAERPAPPRRQVPKQSKGIRTLRAPSESSASVHSVQSMPGPTHRRMPSSDADVLYTDRAVRNASLPQRCAGVCASPAQDMERPVKLFRASALDASAEQRRRCLHRQMRLVDAAMSRVEEMSWLKSLRAGTTPRAAAAAERARLAALRRRYEAELKRVEGGTGTGTGTDTCTGTGTARPPVRVASVVRQASRGRPRAGSTNCAREETRRTLRYGPTAYEYVIDSPQQWRTRHPLAQKTHAPQMRSNAMGYAPQMGSNAMGYAPQMESNAMGHAPQMGSNAMGHAPQMGSNAMGHAPQMGSNAMGYAPQMGSNAMGYAPQMGSNAMGYAPQMGSNAMGYAPQMESNAMGHAPQMGSNAMGHAPQMGSNAMGYAPQMGSNAMGYAPQMGSNAMGHAPQMGSNAMGHAPQMGSNAMGHAPQMGSNAMGYAPQMGSNAMGHVPQMGSNAMGHAPQMGSNAMGHAPQMGSNAMGHAPQMGSNAMGHAPQMGPNAMGHAPQMGSNAMGHAPQMGSNAMGHAPQMGSNAMGHAPQMGSNAMGHAPQMESNAKGYAPQMGSNAKGRAPRTGSNTRVQRSRSVSLDAERMAALYARHTSERRDAPLYWRVAHTNLCADVPAGQYYCTEVGENNADSEKAKAEPSRVSAPFSSSSSSSRALCYSLRAPSRSGEVERKPQPTLCFRMETSPHCNPRLSPPERSVCRADSAAQRTPRALSLQSSEVRVSPLTEGSPFKASPSIQRVVQGPTAVQGMSRALGDDRTNELRRVSDVCASVSPSKRRVESGGVSLRQLFGHNGTVAISPPSASKVCSSTDVLIERIQQMRMLMK